MLTRGPLPSSVYWRRRLLALSVAVVLVVVFAKVLGHGGTGGDQAAMQAAQTGVSTSTDPSTSTPPGTTSAGPSDGPTTPAAPTSTVPAAPTSSVPALPNGMCRPSDVVVTPGVSEATVGEPVTIALQVQTRAESACYWRVSALTLQVKVESRGAQVWSTADCRQAITPQQLTLNNAAPTRATLIWRGHVSDSLCSSHTPWANQGVYSVTATALGGEPRSSTFRLGVPTVIVTDTPTPTGSPTSSASSGHTPSTTASKPAHATTGD